MEDKIKDNSVIKLDNKDRKILKSIDKNSKWNDIKKIEDINNEIEKLDIYDDFIGLGCSRYLIEASNTGKLDIEEMFRNCREAEKVRQRTKKKEIREQRKGGRGGRSSNIGALTKKPQTTADKGTGEKEVDSKQDKKINIMKNVNKIADKVKDILTTSKDTNEIKIKIAKLAYGVGLDILFGIVIAVMEYASSSKTGAVVVSSSMLSLMAVIYKVVVETKLGKIIKGKIMNWFMGIWNKFKNWLKDNGFEDIIEDDNDNDDDNGGDNGGGGGGGGGTFNFDNLNEIREITEEDLQTTPTQETTQSQELTPQQPQQQPLQSSELSQLLRSQSIQQTTALENANINNMFKETVSNPIKEETSKEETSKEETQEQTQEETSKEETSKEQTQEQTQEEPINLHPEPPPQNTDTSTLQNIGMGLGSLLGGIGFGYLTNIGNPLPTTTPTTDIGLFPPTPIETTQPQSLPQQQSLNPNPNIERFLDSEVPQQDTVSTEQAEAQTKKALEEQQKELQRQMDNADLSGQAKAFGLFNNNFAGKDINAGMGSLISDLSSYLTLSQKQQQEQQTIMEDITLQNIRKETMSRVKQDTLMDDIRLQDINNVRKMEQLKKENEEQQAIMDDITLQNVRNTIKGRVKRESLMEDNRQKDITNEKLKKENEENLNELKDIETELRILQGEDRKPTQEEYRIQEEQRKELERIEEQKIIEKELQVLRDIEREEEQLKKEEEEDIKRKQQETLIESQSLQQPVNENAMNSLQTNNELEITEDQAVAEEVLRGRGRGRNVDRDFITDILGLQRGSGTTSVPIQYSYFTRFNRNGNPNSNNILNRIEDTTLRNRIEQLVIRFRNDNIRNNPQTRNLLAPQITELAELLRRAFN